MAGLNLTVASGEVTLTAATALTVLTVKAPANQRLRIKGIEVFFKSTSPTDTPVKIEWGRITTDGQTGTATAVTPAKHDDEMGETAQGTYFKNYGTEPTTYGTIFKTWEVQPQVPFVLYFPQGDEIYVKGGNEFGLRLTAAQGQTCSINLIVEE
jgi:hypothetical protein